MEIFHYFKIQIDLKYAGINLKLFGESVEREELGRDAKMFKNIKKIKYLV